MDLLRVTFWDLDGCLYPNTWALGHNMQKFMIEHLGFRPASIMGLRSEDFYQMGYPVDLKKLVRRCSPPCFIADFLNRTSEALKPTLVRIY